MERYAILSDGYGPASIWAEDDEEALALARAAAGPNQNTQVYWLPSPDTPINQRGRFVGDSRNSE